MVLDQQIPMERAFWAPAELARRLGSAARRRRIAAMDPEALAELFKERPALHRFPGSMAGRVQAVCPIVADEYGGKADAVWTKLPDGATLIGRLTALPGLRRAEGRASSPPCWVSSSGSSPRAGAATAPFGEEGSYISVADITGPESLAKVRAHKQADEGEGEGEGRKRPA